MTDALAYFTAKLEHETDASDVYEAQRADEPFTLVDVRSAEAWAQGHAVGGVHLPHREIAARAADEIDRSLDVVVYCWSPGCNGGTRAAIEFAKLGYRVREMIGGFEYWAREGYPVANAHGPLPRLSDPLVALVRS
ncbi:rhodanese-like domain-containing protein [Microbacterium arborescens]|uniref:rhodanese-like domain-containing protein n=1 Tax=Microbacterium arborescens TaxID=33883 RepID=UPI000DF7D070|nr:rhodanese-like domain-containing protein [Microbacterium arborescens]